MTPRTLWTIILKIFGIYTLTQIYYPLLQFISIILMIARHHYENGFETIGFAFVSVSIYVLITLAFLFKTDWLINNLKLDKNITEEKIALNIHRSIVLTIVILLSGILLFADSLPQFLKEVYSYYVVINDYVHFKQYPRAGNLIVELVKLLISCFMLGCSRLIVNFIERKRRGPQAHIAAPDEHP